MNPGRDPLTLAELRRRFSDEDKCLALLERVRWPHGPECPACGVINHASRITTRPGEFTCLSCMRRFSVTAGTPLHGTHLPLCTWIIATYLLATSSKGISSLKLAGLLGLQYRTVWHLTQRIRAMMDDAPELLRGIVELGETSIGGRKRRSNKPEPQPPTFQKANQRRGKAGRGARATPMSE
jgi:transposase-like protein